MSENARPNSEPNGCVPIEHLERSVAALEQALRQSRQVRMGLTIALLLFIGVTGWSFYRLKEETQSPHNLEVLLQTAQQRLEKRSDYFVKELHTLLNNSSPVLRQAFYEQAKKDLPLYLAAMDKERGNLLANLESGLSDQVAAHHQKSTAVFRRVLKEEFPASEDEELHIRMMASIDLVAQRLAKKYYVDELHAQVLGLYDQLDQFPLAAEPQTGDASLEDQLVAAMTDLLVLKLTESDAAARSLPANRDASE